MCPALLIACGGGSEVAPPVAPPPSPPQPVLIREVIARISRGSLTLGDTVRANAVAVTTKGDTLRDKSVTWSLMPGPKIASVSPDGVVTAIAGGTGEIAATIDGATGTVAVSVYDPTIPARLQLAADSATLQVGDTVRAVAKVFNSRNEAIPAAPVSWSITGGTGTASVSSEGLVTAILPGTVDIEAMADSIRAEFAVTILRRAVPSPSPATVASVSVDVARNVLKMSENVQATAIALDSAYQPIDGRTVLWRVRADSAVATVTATGLVTAVGAGEAAIEAVVDGVVGSATVSVLAPAPPLPPLVALPAAPATLLDFPYPPAAKRQVFVRSGDNLQNVLNAAQRGDEIVLQAGARWTGNFVLPAKNGTVADGWIVVRGENLATLPAIGTRVLPENAADFPKLVTANANWALGTAARASGWRIVGVEITVDTLFTGQHNGLVLLGDGSSAQNSLALVPTDLVLDRVYVHGLTTTNMKRCVALNSARTAITDSYLFDCHGKGFDSQAICMWNGPGPFKIVNNTLAGAGENILIGGSDPSIAGLIPSDIEIRQNFIWTPASWKGVWTKKNLIETKNAQRLLVEGNILDGSWTDGQVGVGVVFKSANQSGRCTWCASRDITLRYNVIRHVAQSLALTGREGNPYPVGERLARVLVEQNVFEELQVAPYLGDARAFLLVNNGSDLTVRRNTWDAVPGAMLTFITFGTPPGATNFIFEQNITTMGRYGMLGQKVPEGEGAFAASVAGVARFAENVIYGSPRPGYFAPNLLVPDIAQAQRMPNVGADRIVLATFVQRVVQR